jgi:polyphosphate glucokinase
LKKLVTHFDWKGPVGCGFPGVMLNGVVKTAANLDKNWLEINAAEMFSDAAGCPVCVLNDADAAGFAEIEFGAGKEQRGLVLVITVGTGIGTSLFTNHHLVPNTELGHIILNGLIAEHYASDAIRKREDLSWKKWARRFDEYLSEIERILWPDLIILGGGISKKFEKFSKYLDTRVEIVPAQLLNEAGIIGAALAANSSDINGGCSHV